MVTSVKEALQNAGVPIKPLNQRVWLWLDGQQQTHVATDIMKVMGTESKSAMFSILSDMKERGMVIAEPQYRLSAGALPKKMKIYSYRTNPRMRGEFELLRLPPVQKKAVKAGTLPELTLPLPTTPSVPVEADPLDNNERQAGLRALSAPA